MSDLIRRSALSDLGSYLTGLISTWPRRNHHYEELQEGINKAVIEHSILVGQDDLSMINRRQALMSLGLVPVQLMSTNKSKKADADTLLTHCAAGITAAWYLRRGKDLEFASDLTSSYISILQPLIYSHSEAYRKASATLLSQSFRLKAALSKSLKNSAGVYYDQAIQYAEMSENTIEQAIAYGVRGGARHWISEHEQALLDEKSLTIPDVSALGAIQGRINYAKTEVSRDDISTRNMDLCTKLLTEAITGAKELDSKRYSFGCVRGTSSTPAQSYQRLDFASSIAPNACSEAISTLFSPLIPVILSRS